MKHLFKKTNLARLTVYGAFAAAVLLTAPGCTKENNAQAVLTVTPVATGLKGPLGLEMDKNGWVWVAQAGTGANDGKVSAMSPQGMLYDVITNFESIPSPGGEPEGPSHLLFADGMLYITGTGGKLYKVPESNLKPGVVTLLASSLAVEDIGAFVVAYNFKNDTQESHPYKMAVGPNGDIYITDAAANAIIRREKNGVLSILTEVPGIPNPTPIGPPQVQSVPTGIYYTGQEFLVTTLLGFPFPAGKAIIYKVTPDASGGAPVSVYQQGFTSLVDIVKGGQPGKLLVEYGSFGQMGWVPNTGRLVWADGTTMTVLADKLNQPAGIVQVDDHTWYVTSFGDNTVLKVTY